MDSSYFFLYMLLDQIGLASNYDKISVAFL